MDNKKTLIIGIIILLFSIASGAVGYFLGSNTSQKEENISNNSTADINNSNETKDIDTSLDIEKEEFKINNSNETKDIDAPLDIEKEEFKINNIQNGDTITSPFTIKGTVENTWFFEGEFPIFILDRDKKSVSTIFARPVNSQNWMTDNPIDFVAEIPASIIVNNGYLIFEKSNPSGLEKNSANVEIKINITTDPINLEYKYSYLTTAVDYPADENYVGFRVYIEGDSHAMVYGVKSSLIAKATIGEKFMIHFNTYENDGVALGTAYYKITGDVLLEPQ